MASSALALVWSEGQYAGQYSEPKKTDEESRPVLVPRKFVPIAETPEELAGHNPAIRWMVIAFGIDG